MFSSSKVFLVSCLDVSELIEEALPFVCDVMESGELATNAEESWNCTRLQHLLDRLEQVWNIFVK